MYTRVSNVWESQARTPEEAVALKFRAELMINLRQFIVDNGWNQKEAAKHLGITQNRVSYIVNGQVSKFSADKLIELLSKTSYQFDYTIKAGKVAC